MGGIDTTSNHPFYVIGKGWVTAGELEVGDEVYRLDGSTAVVTGSELERLTESIKVYNLEVEDYHTYFVGDVPVLVHNYIDENRYNAKEDGLPVRDNKGKIHTNENGNYPGSPGRLPTAEELKRYSTDELEFFHSELSESVKERIRKNIEYGYDMAHGQRQSAEQTLMKIIEHILEDR